jgi:hypothetical protein
MMRILTRRVAPILREILEERFESAKAELLDAVRSHPISVDIMSHAPSSRLNSSRGTLFGFLGFNSGDDPVGVLVDFLDTNITFRPNSSTSGKLFSSSVFYPDKKSFNTKEFELEWTDQGWPIMIEEGISGLPYYLNKENSKGRSSEGIQVNGNEIRSTDWAGYLYLTPLIADFRKNLLL